MRIKDVFEMYFKEIYPNENVDEYLETAISDKSLLALEIPDEVFKKVEAMIKGSEAILASEDFFREFQTDLKKMSSPKAHDAVLGFLWNVFIANVHGFYSEAFQKCVEVIEKGISEKQTKFEKKEMNQFLNVCLLLNHAEILSYRGEHKNKFPGMSLFEKRLFQNEIPLMMNVFRITGTIPMLGWYSDFDLSQPSYPSNFSKKSEQKTKVAFRKSGIKEARRFWPIKFAKKILLSEGGHPVCVALDLQKRNLFFIRGDTILTQAHDAESYRASSVFASKVARLIDPLYFSSERFLDSGLTATRHLESYEISLADKATFEAINEKIKKEKTVIQGSGIIEAVLEFVHETDLSRENFGLSNRKNLDHAHLSKIDFDRCDVINDYFSFFRNKTRREIYENEPLRELGEIFKHLKRDPFQQPYFDEKCRTRLKLSLIPEKLLDELSKKAYFDEKERHQAVATLLERRDLVCELLFRQERISEFFDRYSHVVEELKKEITDYVKSHFDDSVIPDILQSLDERSNLISSKLPQSGSRNILSK